MNEQLELICSILRTSIYIVLFATWGISVSNRIIQPQVRRYLVAISALMGLWIAIRGIKYSLAECPWVMRHLWYLYYLGMLFIPLLVVFIALSLGKPESFRLPKWTKLLYIPTTILLLLVLTNDLHQLVFRFPADATVWMDDYRYGIVYFLAVGWMVLCALTALAIMLVKCRVPHSRKVLVLPFVPVIMALLYGVCYIFRAPWLRLIAADMTVVFCLLFAAALESCIQCGLIQANTHYQELFDAATVGAQITDGEYHVCLSSRAAKPVSEELLRQTEQGPVVLENGIRISGAPIHEGHVVWSEDLSPLMKVLDELKEAKENLEDSNGLLEEENAVKAREAHVAEQERLYSIIQRETAPQIRLMDELIDRAQHAETEEKCVRLLRKMLVIGAYLKRRSNLVFLADKMSILEAKEISLTFGESMDNLEMCGIICGFCLELTESVLAVHIMEMYDFFEKVTERSLDCMSSLTVYVGQTAEGLSLVINTDSAAELSDLASDTVQVCRDEDSEWKLTLNLGTGGDEQ